MTRRTERLNHLIQVEISDLLRRHISDPRLNGLISITRVEISKDLKNATIMVSALGDSHDRDEVIKGFTSASGFLRRELAHRLDIRVTPELNFKLDDSIEKGVELITLIDQVIEDDRKTERYGCKRNIKHK